MKKVEDLVLSLRKLKIKKVNHIGKWKVVKRNLPSLKNYLSHSSEGKLKLLKDIVKLKIVLMWLLIILVNIINLMKNL